MGNEAVSATQELVIICAWCDANLSLEGEFKIEEKEGKNLKVSHAICEPCIEQYF